MQQSQESCFTAILAFVAQPTYILGASRQSRNVCIIVSKFNYILFLFNVVVLGRFL